MTHNRGTESALGKKSRARTRLITCRSLIVITDPLRDCPLQCRASMLPLQFPEGRLGQMRDEWLLPLSHPVVTRNVSVPSQVPTGSMLPEVITRRRDRFSGSLLLRLTH